MKMSSFAYPCNWIISSKAIKQSGSLESVITNINLNYRFFRSKLVTDKGPLNDFFGIVCANKKFINRAIPVGVIYTHLITDVKRALYFSWNNFITPAAATAAWLVWKKAMIRISPRLQCNTILFTRGVFFSPQKHVKNFSDKANTPVSPSSRWDERGKKREAGKGEKNAFFTSETLKSSSRLSPDGRAERKKKSPPHGGWLGQILKKKNNEGGRRRRINVPERFSRRGAQSFGNWSTD